MAVEDDRLHLIFTCCHSEPGLNNYQLFHATRADLLHPLGRARLPPASLL
jgi:predicted RNA polymerase sigma factor